MMNEVNEHRRFHRLVINDRRSEGSSQIAGRKTLHFGGQVCPACRTVSGFLPFEWCRSIQPLGVRCLVAVGWCTIITLMVELVSSHALVIMWLDGAQVWPSPRHSPPTSWCAASSNESTYSRNLALGFCETAGQMEKEGECWNNNWP